MVEPMKRDTPCSHDVETAGPCEWIHALAHATGCIQLASLCVFGVVPFSAALEAALGLTGRAGLAASLLALVAGAIGVFVGVFGAVGFEWNSRSAYLRDVGGSTADWLRAARGQPGWLPWRVVGSVIIGGFGLGVLALAKALYEGVC